MRRAIAVAAIVLAGVQAGYADVRLPGVIGSSMVLQRDRPVPIWGWADAGEEVTLVLRDSGQAVEQVRATANRDGNWRVELGPRPAGGPYSLTINELELTDVLYGEVWLCSGQSNMEWPVMAAADAEMEIAAANYPNVRLFHVPTVPAGSPSPDTAAHWQTASPETVATFSAVAYYFGREIHSSLTVPVGLIASAWGGTKIEPWTPPTGFRFQSCFIVWVDGRRARPAGRLRARRRRKMSPSARAGAFAIRRTIWYQGEANVGHEGMSCRDKMRDKACKRS